MPRFLKSSDLRSPSVWTDPVTRTRHIFGRRHRRIERGIRLQFAIDLHRKRRRALGLYTFMYATIHVLIFISLDYGIAWSTIVQTVFEKPYILVGVTGFMLLIPLAFTSFDIWKKRLGKNWKRLHQVVYLIGPLTVLHYLWSKKGVSTLGC